MALGLFDAAVADFTIVIKQCNGGGAGPRGSSNSNTPPVIEPASSKDGVVGCRLG